MAGSYAEVHVGADLNGERSLVLDVQSAANFEASIQDNVFQDKAGGFTYQHNEKFSRSTRNRSIFWKVSQNCIHLTEVSQDLHLYGNQLKLMLKGMEVLPNVSVHESANQLFVIIATSHSVHRLSWPHPIKEKRGTYISSSIEASAGSIFCNNPSGVSSDAWCFAVLPKKCHSFAANQIETGELLASLVACDGSLVYVTLPSFQDKQALPQIHELKQTSIMKRLWTGFIPTVLRGDNLPHDSVQFCEIQTLGDVSFIFTLCKDMKMRIWSCKSLECIEEYDLTPLLPDLLDLQSGIAQGHVMRKAVNEETGNYYLAVFLNFQFQSQFFAFEMYEDDEDLELSLLSSHFTNLTSLLDFSLTSKHIWALWAGATGDPVLQYACIEEAEGCDTSWQEVILQSSESPRVFIHSSAEPKDIYMSNLFMPGRFSKNVLLKTIKMTAESFDENVDFKITLNSSIEDLRAAVKNVIDFELSNFITDQDIDQDEYYELQMQCWSRFYASAVQYDRVERKPVGMFVAESSGLVTVIRQNYRGYLLSNTWLEQLYQQEWIEEQYDAKCLHDQAGIVDMNIASDVLALIECIKAISVQFTENTFTNIENSISNNDDIKEICAALARDLYTDASSSVDLLGDAHFAANFLQSVQLKLKDRQHLFEAFQVLIDSMDPLKWLPADFESLESDLQLFSVNSSHSFCSREGRAILTESIFNRALLNLEISRDCLLLIDVLICMGPSAGIYDDKRSVLESRFVPRLHEMMRSFFTVVWLRRSTFSSENSDMMESSLKKLAALELVESGITMKKPKWEDMASQSILRCYIDDVGILNGLSIFARLPAESQNERYSNQPWFYDFKLISDVIFRSLWPNREGTDLPEFLFSQGQSSLLAEYLFVCSDWCTQNCGSREFLTAQAYLQNGDHEKARKHFFKVTKFIGESERLLSRLISEEEGEKPKMIISYFIMVMRLFEQFENPDMMIVVATAAIFLAKDSKSKEVAMLWSNIFKSHLQLGHIKDAYQAIVLNPDKLRQRNCLRNFIVTLCERKQFEELCTFSYSSMEDEVVTIIKTRARTVDITINDYYDILYSYHSFRGGMRQAATAMYEYACRLQTEMHGLASLQQQAKCYLAAINCLQICDEKYAWIVRPSEKQNISLEEEDEIPQGRSPKRRQDGEEVNFKVVDRRKGTKKTVVVELADLEKEYLLLVARLNLVQFDKNTSTAIGPTISATDIVPLLCQAGLFDRAFAVALAFKLDLGPIFEGVAAKCVWIASDFSQGVVNDEAFHWLTTNDVGAAQSINDVSAVEQAWRLLRHYLLKFTETSGPIYHKAVATKLLSLGCLLPTWLVNDYKKRNPAELLRIYICFDLLEEAGDLSIEYVNAVLGIGKESFGLKHAVHATSPAVWLPYSALDQLSSLLKSNNTRPNLRQVLGELTEKLERYSDIVRSTSSDKISLAYKSRLAVVAS